MKRTIDETFEVYKARRAISNTQCATLTQIWDSATKKTYRRDSGIPIGQIVMTGTMKRRMAKVEVKA